jgi:hypothetical protein
MLGGFVVFSFVEYVGETVPAIAVDRVEFNLG